ncbi:MAG: ferrochelatase [Gemmatimonadales bacterium]
MPSPFVVLLMAYGGPDSLDDVEPYLLDVRDGRPTSPELVAEIRQRYARIGGRSPIRRLTEAQAAALARKTSLPVYVGMRHWHPFIRETVDTLVGAGYGRVLGIVMAPHYSSLSVGAYERKLLEAADGRLETALVRNWGEHPLFLEAMTDRVRQALQRFPSARRVQVVFTAHSLPERLLTPGDAYAAELEASGAAVAARVGIAAWHFAYQSAGATAEPWLGPDAGGVIERLARQGQRDVLIVPIGFVCDHVEILYDVDVEYRALADRLGVRLERTASLNDDPTLIACLADLVRTEAAGRGWTRT